MNHRPFSQACENNKQPILDKLQLHFANVSQVLEIGSGTGQHAVFFAANLPHLHWHTSDMPSNHGGINQWLSAYPADNLHPPVDFTVGSDSWPCPQADAVFTANTTHIMQPDETRLMLQLIAENLPESGFFCQYGPFNVDGQYTSDSNREFDRYLHLQGCGGIWDIADLQAVSTELTLIEQYQLPANNMLLVWQKQSI
ncbi:DUF938 domain-containing protein [Neptunicella sp.]|uniref:DUF938 domain-containing protein n=1 Tax=Neptunicella sp. TaxID=2125986 RepID=UPI003F68E1D8